MLGNVDGCWTREDLRKTSKENFGIQIQFPEQRKKYVFNFSFSENLVFNFIK
jgi:hypothetical protein